MIDFTYFILSQSVHNIYMSSKTDLLSSKGHKVFESEIIKRIFQQDAAFCFRQSASDGCPNETLWERVPSMMKNHSSSLPKTMAFLFTPTNTRYPEFLHQCGGQLPANTNFNPRHKTEIFIHGYLDGVCRSAWMRVSI